MAMKARNTIFLRLLLFSGILLVFIFRQDCGFEAARPRHLQVHGGTISQKSPEELLKPKGVSGEGLMYWRRRGEKNPRRLIIGSTAPTCSYNECRGCRFKCRAEQVPVDANDPINSAYHYRCVCHR